MSAASHKLGIWCAARKRSRLALAVTPASLALSSLLHTHSHITHSHILFPLPPSTHTTLSRSLRHVLPFPGLFLTSPSVVFSHSAGRFSSLHRPSISGTLGVAGESLEASAAQQTTFPVQAYHLSTSPLIVTLIASLKVTWCVRCST